MIHRPPVPSLRLGAALGLLLALLVLVLPSAPAVAAASASEEAVLAGGCFWCLEHDLEAVPGVLSVESGYSGGQLRQPSYRQVSAGGTGHQEAVRVRFDPSRLSYPTLLRAYWRNVDALDGGGQFCDRGSSYRPVIFPRGGEQQRQARESLAAAARELGRPEPELRVQIRPLQAFWPAEAYHQDYAERNAISYRYYRWACGRDRRLDALWGRRARSSRAWVAAP
jgi:peptide-methionine (S)-S-oxide reductase